MDGTRFDRLARLLAAGGSRRAALGLQAGAALGALVGRGAALADDRDANCRGSCDSCDRDG